MKVKAVIPEPPLLDAVQYTGENWDELKAFAGSALTKGVAHPHLTGVMGVKVVTPGTWVIKGPNLTLTVCKDVEFSTYYKEVRE